MTLADTTTDAPPPEEGGDRQPYEPPAVSDLGSEEDLTPADRKKVERAFGRTRNPDPDGAGADG